MSRTQYRAGIVTVHMTSEQAARWNDGVIDSDGPDGETIMVEWGSTTDYGLPSSTFVSLRHACSMADALDTSGDDWLTNSLESPAQEEPTA